MTVDESVLKNWFEELPIEKYQELVTSNDPETVENAPPNRIVGSPSLQLSVSCGPILRLLATLENNTNNYRGTILLVTSVNDERIASTNPDEPPQINYVAGPRLKNDAIGLSDDFSNGEFEVIKIYEEDGQIFWRFKIELLLKNYEQKVKYSINNEFNENFQFYIPSIDQSMNTMSYSCNGFSLGTDTKNFKGSLWLDVLRKHSKLPYHVMLGGGDQVYADSIKLECEPFKNWLENRHSSSTSHYTEEVAEAYGKFYLNLYLRWFGKGYWQGAAGKTIQSNFPNALAQIPSINIWDDHDIIDGFGSYKNKTMAHEMFKGVGSSAFKYYMLFQHHTPPSEDLSSEPQWVIGEKGSYIDKNSLSSYCRLGKSIAFIGFDCRIERTKYKVNSKKTYEILLNRMQKEVTNSNGDIKHFYVMLGVPIAYPRLVWVEAIMSSKLLAPLKYLAQKGYIAKGLVNEFDGAIELLDDLNDHWCAVGHKHERNNLMAEFFAFSAKNNVRITILSGDVHLCCIGRFKSNISRLHVNHEKHHNLNEQILNESDKDPNLIFNLISSAMTNAAPPDGMATLLNKRNKIHHFRHLRYVDEDMVPIFYNDTNGEPRDNVTFLNKRNYSDLIPVENIPQLAESLSSDSVERVYPGPSKDLRKVGNLKQEYDSSGLNVSYPIQKGSLLTRLHVEVDSVKPESETYEYQLYIPSLSK
ncbi:hypothetical protein B5S33_g889 [[Candida] boidinii]|nr:hypothetical protein B5S33_g889 [[Candida] boidinii]